MRITAKHGGAFALAAVAGAMAAQAAAAPSTDPTTLGLQQDIQTIVFIYAENRAFDNLFGHFPNANGLVDSLGNLKTFAPQLDRDDTTLATLPPSWGGVTAPGNADAQGNFRTVTQSQSTGLANGPYALEGAFTNSSGITLSTFDTTRDLFHRFFENQMQINGGSNDKFAAWGDSGGLVMGYWDYSHSRLYALAQQYTLADNFFMGAFGGSFLNHQYLICACAPSVPSATVSINKMSINTLGAPNAKGVVQLATNASSPASALSGPPSLQTGNIAPPDYFGAGDGYRAVNTMQPPYQPSGNAPVDSNGNDVLYAKPTAATTLPPQTQTTIGDQLDGAGVNWAWYSGSWNAASTDGQLLTGRTVIYQQGTVTNVPNPNDSSGQNPTLASASKPRGTPNFQAHHHPFNYYASVDPVNNAAYRAAHLKDYTDLLADAQNGTLPPVAFYKPTGNVNQHAGYTNADDGDNHIADLVNTLQHSPQWPHMLIVITWDENGGSWDHAAVPQGDLLGPGSRLPALIISPYSKKGTVDHTQYDTASILRLITRKYGLTTLPGLTARDAALVTAGGVAMGDLTNALSLTLPDPAAAGIRFNNLSNARSGALVTSGGALVKSLPAGQFTTINVSGDASAKYSINGGAFTNANGTVTNGDSIKLQLKAGALLNDAVSATLNVGGRSASWTATTGSDSTPDPVKFVPVGLQTRGADVQSNTVTITGISVPVNVTVSGDASAKYSVNGGAFTAAAGTLNPGDTLQLQLTASAAAKTPVYMTVTVGTVNFKWAVNSGN